jgi:HAD superfamily hydrolase (TIGR01549 family)
MTPTATRAVLFDLDDTLFDHEFAARAALEAVHGCNECFRGVAFDAFEREHSRYLEEMHTQVLAGALSIDQARMERFRRLFRAVGIDRPDTFVAQAARAYRERYVSARRAIEGAAALLPLVRQRARVGIVSNNVLEEQRDKLKFCGLDTAIDALVVSEETGYSKPAPEIFEIALERLGVNAADAVMIGDSWAADIVGARNAGIPAIWFNRRGLPAPEPGVPELRSLEPAERVLDTIFQAFGRPAPVAR